MLLKGVNLLRGTFPRVIIILGFTRRISSSKTSLKSASSNSLGVLLLIVILPDGLTFSLIGRKKHALVILISLREMPIEFKYLSKVFPDIPTNGSFLSISVLPGASPTNSISEGIGPPPVSQPAVRSPL